MQHAIRLRPLSAPDELAGFGPDLSLGGRQMIHAIWQTVQRVFKDVFAAAGVLVSAIGILSDLLGKTFILPSWVWWALGVILLFVTASRLQWDLEKEKEKNRKPTPQMPLSEVVSRIIGTEDQTKPGASTLVGTALPSIREKARLGVISVWGRMSTGGDASLQPLEPIPQDYWTNAQIDFVKYLRNQRCSTSDTRQSGYSVQYADLHFDTVEIENTFASYRPKRIRLRSPLTWEER
jgi:hypothetical protein